MIISDITEPVLRLSLTKNLNGAHAFSLSVVGRTALAAGSVVNFSGDCGALACKVQGVKYDRKSNVSTISGSDLLSWQLSDDYIELSAPQDVPTTLSAVSAQADSRLNVPAIACYGPGFFSGSKLAYAQRIAAAFGLFYIAENSGINFYTSLQAADKSAALTGLQISDEWNGKINKIYINKTVNLPQFSKQEIQNGTSSEETVTMLENPNAEDSGFSKSAFIDPWLKTLITISVPTQYIVWNKAVNVGEKKQVQLVSTTDSAANPPWILELWDADPGTPEAPNAQAVKLAELERRTGFDLWQAQQNEICRYARIGRWMPISGAQPVKDFPHYDGVRMTILTWDETTAQAVQAYSMEQASQLSGKTDYNIISDNMLPDQADLIAAGIPQRLLDIDRTDLTVNASVPYISDFSLLNKFTAAGIDRIDRITWEQQPGTFSTALEGEGS